MLIFLIIAALMVILALWFVLPSLWQPAVNRKQEIRAANLLIYQDQHQELEADLKNGLISEEQYQQDKDELEWRLLEDVRTVNSKSPSPTSSAATKKLAYGVAAVLPIGAIAMYFVVGNPRALSSSAANTEAPTSASQQGGMMTERQIAANVDKLAQRLEQNPNDAKGWLMLARSYMVLERYAEATNAYTRLLQLLPPGSEEAKAASDELARAKQLAASRGSR